MKTSVKEAGHKNQEREARIPAGRAELEGELIVPPDAPGIVLFAHGSGSSRHSPRNQCHLGNQTMGGGVA